MRISAAMGLTLAVAPSAVRMPISHPLRDAERQHAVEADADEHKPDEGKERGRLRCHVMPILI
jgi:hypothetical protein